MGWAGRSGPPPGCAWGLEWDGLADLTLHLAVLGGHHHVGEGDHVGGLPLPGRLEHSEDLVLLEPVVLEQLLVAVADRALHGVDAVGEDEHPLVVGLADELQVHGRGEGLGEVAEGRGDHRLHPARQLGLHLGDTTLHRSTLHYTTLHYTTLHYVHYTTLNYTTLVYLTLY